MEDNIIGYKNTGNREFLELHIDDSGVPCPYPFTGGNTAIVKDAFQYFLECGHLVLELIADSLHVPKEVS